MKIFVVGDLCVDVLCSLREEGSLGEEKNIENLTFSLGGNAANFAFAASKLGMKHEFFSAIGKDFATGFLKGSLKSAKINFCLKEVPMQNAFSILLVGKRGEKTTYSNKGALKKFSCKDIEKKVLPRLKPGDIVFFGAYFHMLGLHNGFLQLLKKIKNKGCLVGFDLCFDEYGKWAIIPFLPFIDFLFLNELELRHLSKKASEKDGIEFLFSRGSSNIMLKKGPKGSSFFSDCACFHEKAPKVNELDTTGAGDIFNAAFLKAFIEGKNARQCLGFANFVASAKVAKHGLFIPSQRILKQKLHN